MTEQRIAVVTETSCDLSDEIIERYNIRMVPLRICFSDGEYKDRFEMTSEALYPRLENEIPKSSLPAQEDFLQVFGDLKHEGYTDVLYISISSGLSGTYNFARMLAEEYEGLNITVYDTKTLSCGQGLLVTAAARELEKGAGIEQTIAVMDAIRERMSSYFVVRTLLYLSRGGRIGKVAGTVGSLLHLSPVVTVNDDGVYETAAKSIGFGRALDLMVKEMEKKYAGHQIIVSLVHAMDATGAAKLLDKIKSFSNVVESSICDVTAVLGVHTGPGALGVFAYDA